VGTAQCYTLTDGTITFTRYYKAEVGSEINRYCPLSHPTVLMKKGLFDKFGYYDESSKFVAAEDYELWCRWYIRGVKFRNLEQPLYKYYQNSDNVKYRRARRQLLATILVKINYLKRLNFGPVDYLRLSAEMLAVVLPQRLIIFLFNTYYKFCNK